MNWFKHLSFSRKPISRLPDPYEGLAAISKFLRIKRRSSAFYQSYFKIVDMVEGFVEMLASRNLPLGRLLMELDLPLERTAEALRKEMPHLGLQQETVDYIDSGMPQIWPWLARLMREPTLPEYLEECRWVVEAVSGEKIPTTRVGVTWQRPNLPVLVPA